MKADKKMAVEVELIERILKVLEDGKSVRTMEFSDTELELLFDFNLLTDKPIIYVANISEDEASTNGVGNEYVEAIQEFAKSENSQVVVISAKIEEELGCIKQYSFLETLKQCNKWYELYYNAPNELSDYTNRLIDEVICFENIDN